MTNPNHIKKINPIMLEDEHLANRLNDMAETINQIIDHLNQKDS